MEQVESFVSRAARRIGLNGLLAAGALWLSIGFGLAAALLLGERLLAFGANAGLIVAAPILAAALASFAAAMSRWPTQQAAALRADAQLGLHERLSTALAAGEGPMAELVRADAQRRAAAFDPRKEFPVRIPARARWLALCAVGLAVAALVPPLDVFGWGAARAAREAERDAVRRATDGARVHLGKLAGVASEQGLDRAKQTIEQIDRSLGALAASEPTAEKARKVAEKAMQGIEKARAANDAAAKGAPDARERAKTDSERDLMASTQRILDGFQRELAGEARGGEIAAADGDKSKKGKEQVHQHAPDFVKPQEPTPVPRATVKVESRLLATRPAAEAATRRGDIPWQYRALVRRYFSPGEDGP
ncbi:MAG: hypothetical protein FJ291_33760 [Planctomycetes bacterium]|nr:hypothetical protein [Planctomycetota bacterium]